MSGGPKKAFKKVLPIFKSYGKNLSYFGNIVPCGIINKKVTSLEEELGEKIDIERVKDKLKAHLVNLFEMEII